MRTWVRAIQATHRRPWVDSTIPVARGSAADKRHASIAAEGGGHAAAPALRTTRQERRLTRLGAGRRRRSWARVIPSRTRPMLLGPIEARRARQRALLASVPPPSSWALERLPRPEHLA